MTEANKSALLGDLKRALQITWYDADLDRQVRELMESGMAYLNDKLGTTGDYTVPGYPRTLLFEYVRYARDAALDVFETNYRSLILAMQHQRGVSAYAQQLESAGET